MLNDFELRKDIAVIQSKTHTVRARLCGNETVYSAKDILEACGIKHPDKWLNRKCITHPQLISMTKLDYPISTGVGCRRIMMLFVSETVAQTIVENTPCSEDMKTWIQKEVLTYKIPVVAERDDRSDFAESPSADRVPTDVDSINRMIDRVLIELIEIKKALATGNAADFRTKATV